MTTTPKKTSKKTAIKKEVPKTYKTYSSTVMVNDPLSQASDLFVEKQVGAVSYNEATDTISTTCSIPMYDSMFKRFAKMPYYVETSDAPLLININTKEQWMKNLHRAISLMVQEERKVKFWVLEPVIINEEPIVT